MSLPNLDKIPEEFKTAREIGLAAASLGALARRGLVEVLDTTPKQYRRVSGSAARVYQLCEENKSDYDTYFSLYKKDKKIGIKIAENTIDIFIENIVFTFNDFMRLEAILC